MHGVANGAYLCQQQRTQDLSDRLWRRNTTTAPIKMQYSVRPVPTKYVHMPVVDCRRPANVPCHQNLNAEQIDFISKIILDNV